MAMRYYPVYLDIQNKECLVVGGGSVGTRKVKTLLDCGARVTVVSPAVSEPLAELADDGSVCIQTRPYRSEDLDGKFLVIGATDDESLNRRISADARERNLLCNIADRPAICNFILPSIVQRGDLLIAISTAGKSPAFAKKLRRDLEKSFGQEYAVFLQLLGAIRARLLEEAHAPEAHKPLFNRLIQSDILHSIREGDVAAIDAVLTKTLGPGYSFRNLVTQDNR